MTSAEFLPCCPTATLAAADIVVPAFWARNEKTGERYVDFFTSNIRNPHTRRAYGQAATQFAAFCAQRGVSDFRHVKPIHVAAYVEQLVATHAKPTVKQHLAALRMLFDWLVMGQAIEINPAHAVRGPKHSVKKGKTPVLTTDEARMLLDSIEILRTLKQADGLEKVEPLFIGLRDRALIGLMIYTFARVGAAVQMRVEDVYMQGRRLWVRLHEKGGKEHEMPAHHNLEAYLAEYIEGTAIQDDLKGPLFRTIDASTGVLTAQAMDQSAVYYMIRRRAKAAGIKTKIGCHTFRATGITAYLKNGGRLEVAQQMANHESSRTTGLYDRREDEVSLAEVERIAI